MNLRSLLATAAIAALASSAALAQCCFAKKAAGNGDNAKTAFATDGDEAKLATGCTFDKAALAAAEKSAGSANARRGAKSGYDVGRLARRGIPAMMYRVGDKTTACPRQAQSLAAAARAKVRFVVDKQDYETEGEAKKAYAGVLDRHVNDMLSVKYAVGDDCVSCPITAGAMARKAGKPMMYRVAAYDFKTREAADKALKAARATIENVKLTMKVGDKSYQCGVTAGKMAKAAGKSVQYCVGDKSTACNVTASVNLAMARINAALETLAKAAKG